MRNNFNFITLFVLLPFLFTAQCQEVVKYSGGKFYLYKYDSLWQHTISTTGYKGFNGLTKETIARKNAGQKEYDYFIKEESNFCSEAFMSLYNEKKWALFTFGPYEGKQITEFKFDELFPVYHNKADRNQYFVFGRIADKWALLGRAGKEMSGFEYGLPVSTSIRNHVNDSINFDLPKGKIKDVIPGQNHSYDFREYITSNVLPLIVLEKNNKLGAFDTSLKQLIPFQFDKIVISQGIITGTKEGKIFFITQKGTLLDKFEDIHPVFAGVNKFTGFYAVKQKGKWGFINALNDQAIKCIFELSYETNNFSTYLSSYNEMFFIKKKSYTIAIEKGELKIMDEQEKDVTKDFVEIGRGQKGK